MANYTVPGIPRRHAVEAVELLADRLTALLDLQLTLKHVHWNVVGPHFIAVHEMLDPHAAAVRSMTDELAERMAALGGEPVGTPGAVVERRSWSDYPLGRGSVVEHLAALDVVYTGILNDHRHVQSQMGQLDPATEDLLVGQIRALEQQQWFVRAHLESTAGHLPTNGAKTIAEALAAVRGGSSAERPHASADRPPTAAESAAAERRADLADDDVAEAYQEMLEVGAAVQGEGQIT